MKSPRFDARTKIQRRYAVHVARTRDMFPALGSDLQLA